jgi:hypothetical protein
MGSLLDYGTRSNSSQELYTRDGGSPSRVHTKTHLTHTKGTYARTRMLKKYRWTAGIVRCLTGTNTNTPAARVVGFASFGRSRLVLCANQHSTADPSTPPVTLRVTAPVGMTRLRWRWNRLGEEAERFPSSFGRVSISCEMSRFPLLGAPLEWCCSDSCTSVACLV